MFPDHIAHHSIWTSQNLVLIFGLCCWLAGCRLVDDTHYDYHSCCLHFSFPNPIWAGSVCCCAGTGRPERDGKTATTLEWWWCWWLYIIMIEQTTRRNGMGICVDEFYSVSVVVQQDTRTGVWLKWDKNLARHISTLYKCLGRFCSWFEQFRWNAILVMRGDNRRGTWIALCEQQIIVTGILSTLKWHFTGV